MKISNIFKSTAVALGAVLVLSGCIRETFPNTSTITEEQLMSGQMEVVAENLLKGIPSSMMYVSLGSEHGDYGYHGMGVYNDQAAQQVLTRLADTGHGKVFQKRAQNQRRNKHIVLQLGQQTGTLRRNRLQLHQQIADDDQQQ